MRYLFVIMAGIAMAAAPPSERQDSKEHKMQRRQCDMPINDYEGSCQAYVPRYFYNKTSGGCEQFWWNGCLRRGVYEKRIDCARSCNQNEPASICELDPPHACSSTSRYAMGRYFYNKTSRVCEQYFMCKPLGPELMNNSFSSNTLCTMHCRGFPIVPKANTTKRDRE